MSGSFNRVILVGNVGRDPEFTVMPSGDRLVKISLATTRTWKDANGSKNEKTSWHRIVADEKRFERVLPYVKKGRCILVEGEIDNHQYTDQGGQTRYTTDIRAFNLQLLGGNGNGGSGTASDHGAAGSSEPPPNDETQAAPATRPAASRTGQGATQPAATTAATTAAQNNGQPDEFEDFNPDIPF